MKEYDYIGHVVYTLPYFSYYKKVEKNCIFVAVILDFGPNYMLTSGSKIEKKNYWSFNFTILTQHSEHI